MDLVYFLGDALVTVLSVCFVYGLGRSRGARSVPNDPPYEPPSGDCICGHKSVAHRRDADGHITGACSVITDWYKDEDTGQSKANKGCACKGYVEKPFDFEALLNDSGKGA